MNLRKIVELAARGRILKRRMPPPFERASIIVSPDSMLKYLKPGRVGLDPMLLRIAAEHIAPKMIVWDIGANVGVFSVAAAAAGASVVSFEADTWLAELLERTSRLSRNSGLKLVVVPVAISNRNGLAKLMIAKRGRASNALEVAGGHDQMGGIRETRTVPTLCLDTLCEDLPAPDFLKIDVEGAELLVLEGAHALLNRRPSMLIEVSDSNCVAITRLLKRGGYRLFNPEVSPLREVPTCTPNTLALAE